MWMHEVSERGDLFRVVFRVCLFYYLFGELRFVERNGGGFFIEGHIFLASL